MLERRSALLIVGSPGTNRHRLGTDIIASAEHQGAVVRHTCRLGDADQPDRLLTDIIAELGGPSGVPATDQLATIRHLVRSGHPIAPTLLLQDATFAAPESLSSLSTLAESRDLRIITCMTPETVAMVPGLATVAERVDLEPLDVETITQLLRARFQATPHEVLVAFLHEHSGGGYASLCEVADVLADSGAISVVDGSVILRSSLLEKTRLILPEQRRSKSAERLGGSAGIVDLIDLVSIIGEVEIDEAIACASAEEVALTVRHGPFRHIDGALSMVDPLEAEIVVAALTPARAAELWRDHSARTQRSALRADSAIRAARWYLECGARTPTELAQVAARDANQRGLYHRTIDYTSTDNTAATASETQHERSYALLQTGDDEQLRELFDQLDPAAIPTRELMAFMRWAPQMVPAQELPALRQRAIGSDRTADERQRRAAAITLAELYLLAFCESSDQLVRRVRTLVFSGVLSPVDQAMAHTVLAAFLRHSGRPAEAVHAGRISVSMLESPEIEASAPELDTARETLFMSLIAAQDLAGAADVLQCYQAKTTRYGRSGRLGPVMSGVLAVHRGRALPCLASLELLLDNPLGHDVLRSRGWVEALAAQTLIGLGRTDEAATMLTASEAHPVAGVCLSDLERRITQAFVHDSLADPDHALEILADVITIANAHGLKLVELDALGLTVLIDGPSRTSPLLDATSDLVAPSGSPAMWQAFAPLAAGYNFAGLIQLVDEMLAGGLPTIAGRFAQFALDSGRRATDLTPAERRYLNQLANPDPSQL